MPDTSSQIPLSLNKVKQILAEQLSRLGLESVDEHVSEVMRFEFPVIGMDQLAWLEGQKEIIKIFGADQERYYAIAGIGRADEVLGGVDDMERMFSHMRSRLSPAYPHMQWYGGLAFDRLYMDDPWRVFGTARFVLPRFELAAKHDKMIFACNIIVDKHLAETCQAVLLELDQVNVEIKEIPEPRYEAYDRDDYPDYEHWVKNIDHVQEHIQERVYDKVVLARKTDFHFKETLSPWIILRRLMKVAPQSYLFGFQFSQDKAFVGASPERLYRRAGRAIRTEAIAGTRRRGQNPREDAELKKDLTASPKDLREHQYVVDYVEKILQENTTSFHRDATEVLSLQNGHHLITRFQAELKEGIQDESLIGKLHPTPAVGGSPKEVALPEIRHLEMFSRGWYAGPLGYVGLDGTEMVVAIRSALVQGKSLSVFAGAGIIEGSIPKLEWEEVEHKIANFVKIIDPRRVTAQSLENS